MRALARLLVLAVLVASDELLRAIEGARTSLVNLRDLPDEQLDKLEAKLVTLGKRAGVSTLRSASLSPDAPAPAPSDAQAP